MAEAAAKKAPEPKKESAEAKPKVKRDIVSILVVAMVTINFLAMVGLGLLQKKTSSRIGEVQERMEQIQARAEEQEEAATHEKEKSMGKEVQPPVSGTLYPMDSFLVNISSDQGPKFLQTQMELELPDPALEDEITRKKAALRDAIIVLLSSRTYKQLREASGMGKLRQDILRVINNLLSTGKVKEIYFTQFHFN